jgi:hypothetical protein
MPVIRDMRALLTEARTSVRSVRNREAAKADYSKSADPSSKGSVAEFKKGYDVGKKEIDGGTDPEIVKDRASSHGYSRSYTDGAMCAASMASPGGVEYGKRLAASYGVKL